MVNAMKEKSSGGCKPRFFFSLIGLSNKEAIFAKMTLHEGLTGKLVWKRKEVGLRGGKPVVDLN